MPPVSRGIAPAALVAQVENTAAWALAAGFAGDASFGRALAELPVALAEDWPASARSPAYLRLLLAAHFVTVATFVPTDVDVRIRHHHWEDVEGADALDASVAVVEETEGWPAHLVSARVADGGRYGGVSGHDGEWLAVRAGALGRAQRLGATEVAERLAAGIDRELEREAAAFGAALDARRPGGDPRHVLELATVLAHNVGDLSRVVEAWPRHDDLAPLRARYARLGHDAPERYAGRFVQAGALNKAIMASENHRFLALRAARGLRRSRDLLLPIGPFFDAWAERVARHPALERRDLGEIATAWLVCLDGAPTQDGALRALAGLDRALPGGLAGLADELPARRRKLPPAVREACKTSEERFLARVTKRLDQALAAS